MNFALLPPEINSARMYAGPGSGPMLAAAAAWDELATDLHSTATGYQEVLTALTDGPWLGAASALMAASVAPYVAWLRAASAQAEHTAGQAKAAAAAYEAAFAETVPPPVVLANRSLFVALVMTNFFGQNTPAIALTEAQYAEMWGQDTAAMQSYAGASASATTLTPFAEPPSSTNSGGLSQQTAAVAQATQSTVGDVQNAVTSVQQTMSAVPATLANLAAPAATETLGPLDLLDIFDVELSVVGVTADTILATYALPYDVAGFHVGVHTDDIVSGWAGIQSWPGMAAVPPSPFPVITNLGSSVAAGLGEANSIGTLSVPPGWTTSAPAVRLAALSTSPAASAAAAEASAGGAGSVFSQMALAGMAGRALAGGAGGGAGVGGPRTRERVGVPQRADATDKSAKSDGSPPEESSQTLPGGPITSIAAELRELASLRDAGILTDDEFTEQKRRLLPH